MRERAGEADETRTIETLDEVRSGTLRDGNDVFVEVIESPDEVARGTRIPLMGPLSIGRAASDRVNLVVQDPTISRLHATIELCGARLSVVDHGSHNGTFVGGVRGEAWTLDLPAIVRVGDTLFAIARGSSSRPDDSFEALIGASAAMDRIRRTVRELGPSSMPILLLGETGVGKDVVARAIHTASGRSGPFVAVNAATLPSALVESYLFGHVKGSFTGAVRDQDGYFVAARGGTLFFDEIAELPLDLQPKLLRAVESLELTPVGSAETIHADVRVIAATNADLRHEVQAGTFRADLFARLAGGVLEIPPLRARRSDIPALARHFFATADPPVSPKWSARFVEKMVLFDWPHNVRQLRMAVQRLARTSAETLGAQHFDAWCEEAGLRRSAQSEDGTAVKGGPDVAVLRGLLRDYAGNVSAISRATGHHAKQLYRWFKKHDLDPESYRRDRGPPSEPPDRL